MMLDMKSILTAVDITWTNKFLPSSGNRFKKKQGHSLRQASRARRTQIQADLPHACVNRAEIRFLKDQRMANVQVRVPEGKAEQ